MWCASFCAALVGVLILVVQGQQQEQPAFQNVQLHHKPGPPSTCLSGPFHRDVPSPEEAVFDECLSWQNKACCNTEVPRIIDNHKAVGLYNYSWDLCGTLSQECETFIKDEECFYQCEPMLGYFETVPGSGYIANVPVCASYCDRWFEACKDDQTCVENWLVDFDFAENGNNSCPANSSCTTFRERYGNAEGLCNKMWGKAFFYSRDESNCTVMSFDSTGNNPNFQLSFPQEVRATQTTTAHAHHATLSVILLLATVLAVVMSLL